MNVKALITKALIIAALPMTAQAQGFAGLGGAADGFSGMVVSDREPHRA